MKTILLQAALFASCAHLGLFYAHMLKDNWPRPIFGMVELLGRFAVVPCLTLMIAGAYGPMILVGACYFSPAFQ